jgi:hypothetical protein
LRITYYEETDSAVIWLRERGPDTVGVIAGEDLPAPDPGSMVLHRDDMGELYGIEIYSGAGKRLDLDQIEFQRVPAGAKDERVETGTVTS